MGASLPENVSFFESVQFLKLKNDTSCTKNQYKVNQVVLMPLAPMIWWTNNTSVGFKWTSFHSTKSDHL